MKIKVVDVKALKYWREATEGMTKEERADFAKWMDSLKKG